VAGAILFVDDKPDRFGWFLDQLEGLSTSLPGLSVLGTDAVYAQSGSEALAVLDEGGREILVAVVDIDFSALPEEKSLLGPDARREGLDIARALRSKRPELPIFLFTLAEGDVSIGDPLTYVVPFDAVVRRDIVAVVLRLLAERQVRATLPAREDDLPPSLHKVPGLGALRRLARSDLPVLILGETGTGKSRLAEWIHRASGRRGRFEIVECTQWPSGADPSSMASLLFGQVRGAFTGAQPRAGLCEAAADGTLFLDEIAELRPELQAMLLRAIKERVMRRLGEDRERPVSFRLISATNRAISELRSDLLHRISGGVPIELLPLRDRPEDIAWLAERELARINDARDGRGARPLFFDHEALRALEGNDWPGNGHELAQVISAASLAAVEGVIRTEHLPLPPGSRSGSTARRPTPARLEVVVGESLEMLTRRYLLACWQVAGFEAPRAADLGGVGRATMWRTLRASGIALLAGEPASRFGLNGEAERRLRREAHAYLQRLSDQRLDVAAKAAELQVAPSVLEHLLSEVEPERSNR
jgi:DNA-binding NtrC family response regulator